MTSFFELSDCARRSALLRFCPSTAKTLSLTVAAGLFEEAIESNTGHFRCWQIDPVAKVFLRRGTQILRAVGATIA
jgi:hypothetical protein